MRVSASITCTTLIAAVVATGAGGAAPAAATPHLPHPVLTLVAKDCRNLGVTISLTPEQQRRASRLLPRGFTLASVPTALIESSQCATATANGKAIGPIRLAEAAISVVPPRQVNSKRLDEAVTESIFMLSQLDSNAALSRLKGEVGYPSEVTDVSLNFGAGGLPTVMTASAGGTIAPASVRAQMTPGLLPATLQIPNPGVITKLWAKDSKGRFVVTINNILTIGSPAAGTGTVSFAPGTSLHKVFGARTVSGPAFSGSSSKFINDTYVLP